MLFSQETSLLFITKSNVFLFICRKKQNGSRLAESWGWNADTIVQLLLAIKKKAGLTKTRIILGDDIVYLASLWIDKEKISSGMRSAVEQKLAGLFPEELGNIIWDYKKFLTKDRKSLVQAAGINKGLATVLENAFLQSKISVSLVEPFSFTIAKETSTEENPHFVVYFGEVENIILFCSKGVVFHSQMANRSDLEADLKQFIAYIKESYTDILPEKPKLFYSGYDGYDPKAALDNKDIEIVNKKLDPVSGFVYEEAKGSDEDVLNIDLKYLERKRHSLKSRFRVLIGRFKKKNGANQEEGGNGRKVSRRLIIMLVVVIVLLSAAAVFLFNKYKDVEVSESAFEKAEEIAPVSDSNAPAEPEPVVEESEKLVEPPAEVYDLKDSKIQVLNGSGIAGEAGRIKGILNDAGYENVDIGNADSSDYENITISIKKGIPQNAFDEIKGLLTDITITISETPLEDSDQYDVIIILGK